MKIHRSARKHGVADRDIEHAVRNAMNTEEQPRDRRLHLGPARDGQLLEVVTAIRDELPEVAIRAMPMRRKYERLLPKD